MLCKLVSNLHNRNNIFFVSLTFVSSVRTSSSVSVTLKFWIFNSPVQIVLWPDLKPGRTAGASRRDWNATTVSRSAVGRTTRIIRRSAEIPSGQDTFGTPPVFLEWPVHPSSPHGDEFRIIDEDIRFKMTTILSINWQNEHLFSFITLYCTVSDLPMITFNKLKPNISIFFYESHLVCHVKPSCSVV